MLAATVLHVDTFDDVVDVDDGVVSLREAIIEANDNAGDFEIQLQAGTYWLTIAGAGEDAAATGDLDILLTNIGGIKIIGAGQTIIHAGGDGASIPALGDRVFHVRTGASLAVEGVTVTGGTASVASLFPSNRGGGFLVESGSLILTESEVSGNSADQGGGIYVNNFGFGSVTITNSTLSQNTAFGSGGGINNASGGSIIITGSTLSQNTAMFGGGIANSASLTITDSSVSANAADQGGGILNGGSGSRVTIANSTLSQNTANREGGGIYNTTDGNLTITSSTLSHNSTDSDGGGIFNISASTTITGSTLSQNTASREGGGIYSIGGNATLTSSTLTGNRAIGNNVGTRPGGGLSIGTGATTILHNTIVAGNFRHSGTMLDDIFNNVALDASSSYNLIGTPNAAGGLIHNNNGNILGDGNGNPLPIAAILDSTLADNGGPTLTHALVSGSPAINAGDPNAFTLPLVYDQRGEEFDRVRFGRIDIGAFELQADPPPVDGAITVGRFDDVIDPLDGLWSLREAINEANDNAGDFEIRLPAGTYWLNIAGAGEDLAQTGDLDILSNHSITIIGADSSQTIINAGGDGELRPALGDRIFHVHDGASLTVEGITVTGGTGVSVQSDGGGFYNDGGVLVLNAAQVSGNSTSTHGTGGGIHNVNSGTVTISNSSLSGNSGRAIYNHDVGSIVTITDSTLIGNSDGAIFNTFSGIVSITNSTISGNTAGSGGGIFNDLSGSVSITNSIISGNTAIGAGGIFNDRSGSVTLTNSTLSGNTATGSSGGGISNRGSGSVAITSSTISGNSAELNGGGIFNSSLESTVRGSVSITDSTLTGNSATSGGAIHNRDSARVTIANSVISDNTTEAGGGGITNGSGSSLTIVGSSLSGNSAGGDGGGVWNGSLATMTLASTTMFENSAGFRGGAVANSSARIDIDSSTLLRNSAGGGGGVYNVFSGSSVTIRNSTLSANSANEFGAGIYNTQSATVAVTASTLTANRADVNEDGFGFGGGLTNFASAVLQNTIVAGNFVGMGGVADDVGGNIGSSTTFSLIGDVGTSGGLSHGTNGNIIGDGGSGTLDINAILNTVLADNGGPTLTHALVSGSPAINAGDPNFDPNAFDLPLVFDQRGDGFERILGGRIDIGSFEAEFTNTAPTANAGGPYVVDEGAAIVLDSTMSSDPDEATAALTFEWDLDYDGTVFDVDATGIAPSVSFPDDFATRAIAVRVTDSAGESDIATTALTVNNVAPSASIAGSPVGVPNQPLTFTLDATDPSPVDEAAGMTFAVDWDGDGTSDREFSSLDDMEPVEAGIQVVHSYDSDGDYTINVTATDKDGGVSGVAAIPVEISGAAIQDGTIVIGTSDGSTDVVVTQGSVIVTFFDADGNVINEYHFEDDDATAPIVIYGSDQDDNIRIDADLSNSVEVYAGAGNDVIQAGGGTTIVDGGEGNDVLIGGTGTNTLIGGDGDDVLQDGGGTNTIIGGGGSNTFVAGGGTNTFEAASGSTAPEVFADSYTMDEDTVLTIPAQGVLANDIDPSGEGLTATLIAGSGPAHGTLVLNADGSFEYTPGENFNGIDSFRYLATNNVGETSEALVTITSEPVNDTDVSLDAENNLVITDSLETTDDNLTIHWDAANAQLVISDPDSTLNSTIAGATGSGSNSLAVPLASFNGIIIDTGEGDDTTTLTGAGANLAGGLILLAGPGFDVLTANADLSFAAGASVAVDTETISVSGSLSTSGTGAIELTASRNIALTAGSSVTTVDGDLTLLANDGGITSGNFTGISAAGTTIRTAGTGDVSLTGFGGTVGADNYGIHLHSDASVASTALGPTAGTVMLNGVGGSGTSFNRGVYIAGATTEVASVDGDISITGQGGTGTGDGMDGIDIRGRIIATGTGPYAASITINGTGGSASTSSTDEATGVTMQSSSGLVQSADGTISISGQGGIGNVSRGVEILFGADVIASGTGSIEIIGTGGVASNNNNGSGFFLFNGDSRIQTKIGDIAITGVGADSPSGFDSSGISIFSGGVVTTTSGGSIVINARTGPGSLLQAMVITGIIGETSGTGDITLNADDLLVNGVISSANTVALAPTTPGRSIVLGADASGLLSLTDTELDRVTAGILQVGNSNAGGITVSSAISPAGTDTLHLLTGGTVSQSAGISVANLTVSAVGTVNLAGTFSNDVDVVSLTSTAGGAGFWDVDDVTINSMSAAGNVNVMTRNGGIMVADGAAAHDIDSGGHVSLVALGDGSLLRISSGADVRSTGGALDLGGDKMDIAGTITASGQHVTLRPLGNGNAIDLGSITDVAVNTLELSDAELDRITAALITIGHANSGNLSFSDDITLPVDVNLRAGVGSIAFNGSHLDAGGHNVTLVTSSTGGITTGDITGSDIVAADLTITAGSSGIGSASLPLRLSTTGLAASTPGGEQFLVATTPTMITGGGLSAGAGNITLAGGTFSLGGPERIDNSSRLDLGSGAVVRLNGFDETLARLTGRSSSRVVNGSADSATLKLNLSSVQGHTTFAGIFGGPGDEENNFGIVKNGTDQFLLHRVHTYDGLTTINAGSINLLTAAGVPATLGSTNSPTVVNDGGRLFLASSTSHERVVLAGTGRSGWALAGGNGGQQGGNMTLTGDAAVAVFNPNSTFTISGAIDDGGNGHGLTVHGFHDSSRTIVLAGANTYSGQTTILSPVTLQVDGSIGGSGLQLVGGSRLTGAGEINAPVVAPSGAEVSPGPAAGTLATGDLTLAAGATYTVELNGPDAGSGYDQLDVTGTVEIDGAILTVTRGFLPENGASFILIANDGTDAVAGTFAGLAEGAVLTVDGRDFVISYTGGDGNDVELAAVPTTFTWDGGGADNHWTTAENWTEDIAPLPGDALIFQGAGVATINDFEPGTAFRNISFVDHGFRLSGNAITLDAAGGTILLTTGVDTNGLGTQTIDLPLTLGAAGIVEVHAGSFVLTSAATIDTNGHLLTFSSSSSQRSTFLGSVTGSGGLTVNATKPGGLNLRAVNTYSGLTTVEAGSLAVGAASTSLTPGSSFGTLGDGTSGTVVKSGATLDIGTSTPVTEHIVLEGRGFAPAGGSALRSIANGVELAGDVTLLGDTQIGVTFSNHAFTISGNISGDFGVTARLNFGQSLVLTGANTYSGPTQIVNAVGTGTLVVNGSLATHTAVNVQAGTALGGEGTIEGSVVVNTGGTLSPGVATGILNTGSVNLNAGSTFSVELDGTMAGTEHDQVEVTGSVSIFGANLQVARSFDPAIGTEFTLIVNDGTDPVSGTFAGLAEGAVISVDGLDFVVTYTGGDGNDVVLTRNTPPAAHAGGPYINDEGTTFMLDAAASFDPDEPAAGLMFEWDLDYDGVTFDIDANGIAPSISFPDEFAARTIALRVTDAAGESDIATTSMAVSNVAPAFANLVVTPVIDENGVATVTGQIIDPGNLDTFTLTIDWGDPLSPNNVETIDFSTPPAHVIWDPVARQFSATHQSLDDNPAGTPLDQYTINVTVTDDDGGSDTDQVVVTVLNVAPTASTGPDQTVNEGDFVTLSGSFADPGTLDTRTFLWTVSASNGQAIADGTGQNFSFTPDDNGIYTVNFTVSDDDGGSHTDQVVVTVENGAPTASVIGPSSGVRNQPRVFTLSATDLSPIDQAAGFTYSIDWESDGIVDQTVIGNDALELEHAFAAKGTYVISVTASDKDGTGSAFATHTIEIAAAAVDNRGNLNAGGANVHARRGSIILEFLDDAGNIVEQLSFAESEVTGSLIIYGSAGHNEFRVDGELTLPVILHGGAGDDVLQGGGGENLILGGEGDDVLIGGIGTNTLDGADGNDTLVDGGGTNTIIGGSGSNTFVPGGGTNSFEVSDGGSTGDADPPQLVVTPEATGHEGAAIPLPIWAGLSDTDGSETLTLTISGLPVDAVLSLGHRDTSGDWVIEASGTTLDLSQLTLTAADDGIFALTITAKATETANGTTSSIVGTVQVAILNVAPQTVAIAGPLSGVRGQSLSYSSRFIDPGSADTHSFRWQAIDSAGALVASGLDAAFSFIPEEAGDYTVVFAVIDDNGGQTTTSLTLHVTATALKDGELYVGGTTSADAIRIVPSGGTGGIEIIINGASEGPFHPTSRIIVFGQAGDDDLQISGSITLSAWLYGGEGHDRLKGGAGHDILLGENGDDLLVGGGGRDLIEGGNGADRIVGNAEDDLLIAGKLNFFNLEGAISAIMREWTRTDKEYLERIANLENGTGLNGNIVLTTGSPDATVVDDDDDSQDVLTGSAGLDWFFFKDSEDRATDLRDEVFADDLDWITAEL